MMSLSDIGSKFVKKVGTFFGVAKNELGEQWKKKVEKRVKNEGFGLSIQGSFHSRKSRHDSKFVKDAEKVLSQINAVREDDDGGIKSNVIDPEAIQNGQRYDLETSRKTKSYPADTTEQDKHTKESNETAVKRTLELATLKNHIETFLSRKRLRENNSLSKYIKSKAMLSAINDSFKDEEEGENVEAEEYEGSGQYDIRDTSTQQATNQTHEPKIIFFEETLDVTPIARKHPKQQARKSDEIKKKKDEDISEKDLVYGKVALQHYTVYRQIEKNAEKPSLISELEDKMSEYDWKLEAIDDLILMAKDYYLNPKSENALKWRDLKKKVRRGSRKKLGGTEVRRKLDTLPEYRPYFTWFITLVQVVAMAVICGLGGITYVGLEPRLTLEKDIKTLIGTETIHKWTPPNIWLGPSDKYMISIGSFFAPCMRDDFEIKLMYSIQNFSHHSPLGCCEIRTRNIAGTTTQAECTQVSEGIAVWKANTTCANRPGGENSVRHDLKPCCLGLRGQCRLLSHRHCKFLDGLFHQFGVEHCSQVNCLASICHPGNLTASAVQPWLPASPHQWWRLPLSLIYHHGILHVLIVAVAQWLLLTQIERTAGWLRMLIIYLLSGMGALIISAMFTPYQCHMGGVGAVFGMVGVILVELVQFWNLVQNPVKELAKILGAIIIFIFCGTLPYLDVYEMFGGLLIGVLSGIIVLPYITFGKWQTRARVFLIVVGMSLLFIVVYVMFHLFIKVQSVSECSACTAMNCISYTENMCNSALWVQF